MKESFQPEKKAVNGSVYVLLKIKNFQILSLNSCWKTDLQTAKLYEHSLSMAWTSPSKQDSFLLIQQVHLMSKKWMMSEDTRNNCNNFEKPTTRWKSSKECVTSYLGSAIKLTATSTNVKQAATAPQNHTKFSCLDL